MKAVLRFFFIVFMASLLVISLIAYWLAKYLSSPIVELAGAAERISSGGFLSSVRVKAIGEVQTLVDSFNQMTENLKKTTVSRDYVDNIINSMMDTLIVTSREGTIMRVNQTAGLLLGSEEQELVGRSIDQIILTHRRETPGWKRSSKKDRSAQRKRSTLQGTAEEFPCCFRRPRCATADRSPALYASARIYPSENMPRRSSKAIPRIWPKSMKSSRISLISFPMIFALPWSMLKGFPRNSRCSLSEMQPCFEKHFPLLDPKDREKIGPVLRERRPGSAHVHRILGHPDGQPDRIDPETVSGGTQKTQSGTDRNRQPRPVDPEHPGPSDRIAAYQP